MSEKLKRNIAEPDENRPAEILRPQPLARSPESLSMTNEVIDRLMQAGEQKITTLKRQWELKRELGLDPFETNAPIERNEKVHWTEVLSKRTSSASYRGKYLALSKKAIERLEKDGDPDKPKTTKNYYYDKIRSLNEDKDRILSKTASGPAINFFKQPSSLGVFNEEDAPEGAVFSNSGLTDSQKMIIESHEKGHAMRTFPQMTEIREAFDYDKHSPEKRTKYLMYPDELVERMSQLKNYFGLADEDLFARKHLAYAKENYINDTKLDNSMTDFFNMITSEKENNFLEIINSWPI